MRIGFFDSGLGGLTVYRAVHALLPHYDSVYLGDSARTPYGNRSFDAVLKFTTEGVARLLRDEECALVVIACNTASAKALRTLQQNWLPVHFPDRRILGVIRPSVEAMAARPGNKRVAIWATEGTVRSQSYALELAKHAPGFSLTQVACPMLVPLVESGELTGPVVDQLLSRYWRETVDEIPQVDTLLLACTHYPLLAEPLRRIVPKTTGIITQGEIVAPSLRDYLTRHPEIEKRLGHGGQERFLTTDRAEGFDRLAALFLGRKVAAEQVEI